MSGPLDFPWTPRNGEQTTSRPIGQAAGPTRQVARHNAPSQSCTQASLALQNAVGMTRSSTPPKSCHLCHPPQPSWTGQRYELQSYSYATYHSWTAGGNVQGHSRTVVHMRAGQQYRRGAISGGANVAPTGLLPGIESRTLQHGQHFRLVKANSRPGAPVAKAPDARIVHSMTPHRGVVNHRIADVPQNVLSAPEESDTESSSCAASSDYDDADFEYVRQTSSSPPSPQRRPTATLLAERRNTITPTRLSGRLESLEIRSPPPPYDSLPAPERQRASEPVASAVVPRPRSQNDRLASSCEPTKQRPRTRTRAPSSPPALETSFEPARLPFGGGPIHPNARTFLLLPVKPNSLAVGHEGAAPRRRVCTDQCATAELGAWQWQCGQGPWQQQQIDMHTQHRLGRYHPYGADHLVPGQAASRVR